MMNSIPAKVSVACATVLWTLVAAIPSYAQAGVDDDMTEQLLACDGITDTAAKMACFDSVVKGLRQQTNAAGSEVPVAETASVTETLAAESAVVTESPPAKSSAAAKVPATDSAAVAETTAAEPAAAPIVAPVAETTAPAQPANESIAPAAAAATTASVATSSAAQPEPDPQQAAVENFGLGEVKPKKKQVVAPEKEIESIHATIVEVWPTIDDRFEVRLDNGQIWRETELTRTRTPKVGSSVRITKASLGSFRMKVGNDNRLAAVRRTQ